MFAVDKGRAFLKALSELAFENEDFPPWEIRQQLRQFAAETGQSPAVIRLMHFERLHSFWPEDRTIMRQNRTSLEYPCWSSELFGPEPLVAQKGVGKDEKLPHQRG